jgi:hypothetical protein
LIRSQLGHERGWPDASVLAGTTDYPGEFNVGDACCLYSTILALDGQGAVAAAAFHRLSAVEAAGGADLSIAQLSPIQVALPVAGIWDKAKRVMRRTEIYSEADHRRL